jgi:hypothetical protein
VGPQLQPRSRAEKRKEASISFLKKRNKKLCLLWLGVGPGSEPNSQKFFGSFFQKRTFFCLIRLAAYQRRFDLAWRELPA